MARRCFTDAAGELVKSLQPPSRDQCALVVASLALVMPVGLVFVIACGAPQKAPPGDGPDDRDVDV